MSPATHQVKASTTRMGEVRRATLGNLLTAARAFMPSIGPRAAESNPLTDARRYAITPPPKNASAGRKVVANWPPRILPLQFRKGQVLDFIGTASWARTTDPQIHNLVL